MILRKLELNNEVVSAVFIIILNTILALAGFSHGFIWPLFILVAFLSFYISFLYPRSGIFSIIFLTLIFERFFTLAPVFFGFQEYKIYPLDVILVAVFAASFLQITVSMIKNNNFKFLPENKYLIIFFALVSIHLFIDLLFFKADKNLILSSFKYYVFYPWIYFVVLFLFKREEDFLRLIKFYFAGLVGILFFIIFGILNRGGLWTEYTPLSTEGIRILAFTHGFYVLMGLLGLLTWSLYRKQVLAGWMKFLIIFWIIGLIGTLMRHLWIGFVFSILMLYILSEDKIKNIFKIRISQLIGGFVLMILLVIFAATISPGYTNFNKAVDSATYSLQKRASSIFSSFENDESFSWRELVWKESFREYIKNPLWGMGFGKKIYVESMDYRDFVEVRNIHNSWLVLLFQGGIFIFGFFACFVYILSSRLAKTKDKNWQEILLLVLLLNYFVVAIFQPYWETNMLAIFFWIILGLIGTISSSSLKGRTEEGLE